MKWYHEANFLPSQGEQSPLQKVAVIVGQLCSLDGQPKHSRFSSFLCLKPVYMSFVLTESVSLSRALARQLNPTTMWEVCPRYVLEYMQLKQAADTRNYSVCRRGMASSS